VETENARLAADNISAEQLAELREVVAQEKTTDQGNIGALVELDFEFHLLISIASENMAYPLILNSFKSVYTHFTSAFYVKATGASIIDEVFTQQSKLLEALEARNTEQAGELMKQLLVHGESFLLN